MEQETKEQMTKKLDIKEQGEIMSTLFLSYPLFRFVCWWEYFRSVENVCLK